MSVGANKSLCAPHRRPLSSEWHLILKRTDVIQPILFIHFVSFQSSNVPDPFRKIISQPSSKNSSPILSHFSPRKTKSEYTSCGARMWSQYFIFPFIISFSFLFSYSRLVFSYTNGLGASSHVKPQKNMTAVSVSHAHESINNAHIRQRTQSTSDTTATTATAAMAINSDDGIRPSANGESAVSNQTRSPPTNSSSSDTDIPTTNTSTSSSSTTALRRMYFKSAKLGKTAASQMTAAAATTTISSTSMAQPYVPKVL